MTTDVHLLWLVPLGSEHFL